MRDPAIHLRRSDFVKILKTISGIDVGDSLDFTAKFFEAAPAYQISNRSYIESAQKVKKPEVIVKELAEKDFQTFNGILTTEKLRVFPFLKPVHMSPGSTDYKMVTEICGIANDFCESFLLDKAIGYRHYVRIALDLMHKGYRLNKFKFLSEDIFNIQHSHESIVNDMKYEETLSFHNIYAEMLAADNNMAFNAVGSPKVYINFLHGREQADDLSADYTDYITAQFAGLSFANSYPTPIQLYGDKAIERYRKYTYGRSKTEEITAKPFESSEEEDYYNKYIKKHA